MIYVILIIILLLTALFTVSFIFVRKFLFPEAVGYEENYSREIENGSFDEKYYKSLEKEEFDTNSDFGYSLHGMWFPNKDSKDTIILVHGFTANLYTSFRYLRLFVDKGYNVLAYDHRYHGKSGGKCCTMGYYEKKDLRTMVSWVFNKTGPLSVVGIHGESMGAATAIMHAAVDDRISFTIADCPYADLSKQLSYRLKVEYKLPVFPLIYTGSLMSKLAANFFFRNVSPLRDITDIKTPIMFIHGDEDDFIPPANSIHMYQTMRGRKGLYLAKGAKHAEAVFVDRNEYEKVVYRFIDSLKPVED